MKITIPSDVDIRVYRDACETEIHIDDEAVAERLAAAIFLRLGAGKPRERHSMAAVDLTRESPCSLCGKTDGHTPLIFDTSEWLGRRHIGPMPKEVAERFAAAQAVEFSNLVTTPLSSDRVAEAQDVFREIADRPPTPLILQPITAPSHACTCSIETLSAHGCQCGGK